MQCGVRLTTWLGLGLCTCPRVSSLSEASERGASRIRTRSMVLFKVLCEYAHLFTHNHIPFINFSIGPLSIQLPVDSLAHLYISHIDDHYSSGASVILHTRIYAHLSKTWNCNRSLSTVYRFLSSCACAGMSTRRSKDACTGVALNVKT